MNAGVRKAVVADASKLSSRFGGPGPLTTADANGRLTMGNFTLQGIGQSNSVCYDAASAALSVLKDGVDITSKILDGSFLGQRRTA